MANSKMGSQHIRLNPLIVLSERDYVTRVNPFLCTAGSETLDSLQRFYELNGSFHPSNPRRQHREASS